MLTIKEAWRRFKRDRIVNIAAIGFILILIEVGVFTIISQHIIFIICFAFVALLGLISIQTSASHSAIIDKLEEVKK